MNLFDTSFEIEIIFNTYNGREPVSIVYEFESNRLSIYKLGYNFSVHRVPTVFKDKGCPVCGETRLIGNTIWDCKNRGCALGVINTRGNCIIWQDKYNIDKLKGYINNYYEHNKSIIVSTGPTIIDCRRGDHAIREELSKRVVVLSPPDGEGNHECRKCRNTSNNLSDFERDF